MTEPSVIWKEDISAEELSVRSACGHSVRDCLHLSSVLEGPDHSGGTTPRQESLDIRKLAMHEPNRKPVVSLPPWLLF